jgi:hypothetical protein
VGAFYFQLFVNRFLERLLVTADPDDCSATVTFEVDGGRGPIHPPSVPLDLGEPWALRGLAVIRGPSRLNACTGVFEAGIELTSRGEDG